MFKILWLLFDGGAYQEYWTIGLLVKCIGLYIYINSVDTQLSGMASRMW